MSETVFIGACALAVLTVIACVVGAFIREPAAMLLTIAILVMVKPLGYLLERWLPME